MLFKKSYIFLIIFIFLLSISAINAQELDNDTGISQISSEIDDKGLYESYNPGSFNELYTLINEAENGSTINLEKDYVDYYSSTISINKRISINGNNHILSGNNGFFSVESDNVSIKNIYFKEFKYSVIDWRGDNGVLEGCTFFNNSRTYNGSPIMWRGENGMINNCKFDNNTGDNSGAVYWIGNYGVLNDCEFNYNLGLSTFSYANGGGAIYWNGDYGVLNDCKFRSNRALSYYGSNTYGGAIYWKGNNGILSNLDFYYNYATFCSAICYNGDNGFEINCYCYENTYYSQKRGLGYYEINSKSNNFKQQHISLFEGLSANGNDVNITIDKIISNDYDSTVTFEIHAYDNFNREVSIDSIYTYFDNLESFDIENNKATIKLPDNYLKNNAFVPIQVVIKQLNIFKSLNVYTEREISLDYNAVDESSPEITIIADKNINSKANIKINDLEYSSEFKNGVLELNVMFSRGNHTIEVTLDDPIFTGHLKFNVFFKHGFLREEHIFNLTGENVVSYYKNCKYIVKLTDYKGNPKANENLIFNFEGKTYNRTTNNKGIASLVIGSNPGIYTVDVKYVDEFYAANRLSNEITVLPTITANDVTKIYKNNTQYYSKFVDSAGNPLINHKIEFNINGLIYTRTTNDMGIARMNINLNPGEYIITSTNPKNGEKHSNIITVLPSIVENKDLNKYFRNNSQYTVKIIGANGKPVGSGEKITFNINGVFYTRNTNDNGIAKLNINLNPGKYTITAEYNTLKVSNIINIYSVLSAKNLEKEYGSSSKFEVKVLNGQGKSYPNQKVTFNINGVFYDRVSDSSGYARLNINLLPGNYIITSMYNGLSISNTVKVNQKYYPDTSSNNGYNSGSNYGQSNTLCFGGLTSNAFVEVWIYTGSSSNYYAGKTDIFGDCSIPVRETVGVYHDIEVKTSYTGLNYKYYSGYMIIHSSGYVESHITLKKHMDPSKISLNDIKIYT